MGSKKLKAIAVSGSGSVTLKDPDAFNELARQSSKTLAEVLPMLREQGTALYVDVSMMFNDMPIKYFQEIEFDVDSLNSTAMEAFLTGRIACYSCPIGCGRKVSIPDCGLDNVAGPEFQTIAAFGTNLMISDLQSVMLMNRLCNQYGMDTISCGSTIAFAVHLCDHEKADFDLKWGDAEKNIQLIHDIANRKELGNILADGAWRLAQAHDAEDIVLHVKGMEVPNHDPRAFSGMTTIYAVASRGATHLEGDMYSVDMGADTRELGIISGDRLENEGKGIIAAKAQDYRAFFDTLIMCHFALVPPENIMKLLNLATGYSLSVKESLMIGARAVTLKRLFNLKCGLKPEQDTIPAPLLKPQPDSVTEDFTPDLEMQLKDYYNYRKWDRKTGEPSNEALEKLAEFDRCRCEIVEMRYFGGLTVEEIADVLKVHPNTVKRDWRAAKAWLPSLLVWRACPMGRCGATVAAYREMAGVGAGGGVRLPLPEALRRPWRRPRRRSHSRGRNCTSRTSPVP